MFSRSTVQPGAMPALALLRDEHQGIRTIGRLVLVCAGVLLLSALLLIGTALQIVRNIEQGDLDAERQRAANAIDVMTAKSGPLTAASATMLGQIAGLRDAHLAMEPSPDEQIQQIPLLGEQGPSGSYLVWSHGDLANDILGRSAPIRLPIIGGMLLAMFLLLMRLRHLVAELDRERRAAHRQSRTDVLTGLANRLALDARLVELTAANASFAVMALDLDRFKEVNDAFGHAAGDTVLREFGARIARLLGPLDLLARVGGDEFIVVVAGQSGLSDLTALADQCIASVARPFQIDYRAVSVGVSLGIVPPAATPHVPGELVAMADAALYRAKSRCGSSFNLAGDQRSAPQFRALA